MIHNGKNFELVIGYKLISDDRLFSFESYLRKTNKTCEDGCTFPKFYLYIGLFGYTLIEYSLFK